MKFTSPYSPEQLRVRMRDASIYGFQFHPNMPKKYLHGWYRNRSFCLKMPTEATNKIDQIHELVIAKGKIESLPSGSKLGIWVFPRWYEMLFCLIWSFGWFIFAVLSSWHTSVLMPDPSWSEWLFHGFLSFMKSPFLLPPLVLAIYYGYSFWKARAILLKRMEVLMELEFVRKKVNN